MELNKHQQIPQMEQLIDDIEGESFVGRTKELDTYLDFINSNKTNAKILHLHGIGGIGKTFLLQEYARFAKKMRRRIMGNKQMKDRTYVMVPVLLKCLIW